MAITTPFPSATQTLALDAKYGPNSAQALQRSQYLADALRTLQASGENIRTPTALVGNLAAAALLRYKQKGADKDALNAVAQDRQSQIASLLSGLGGAAPASPAPAPVPAQPPALPPVAPTSAPSSTGTPPEVTNLLDSGKRDLLARLLVGEAGNQGDRGQQAVAAVVNNRAANSGRSLEEVMAAKGQFEPLNNPATRAKLLDIPTTDPGYQRALGNANAIIDGQMPDPTGGADHFYAPKAQAALGRSMPAWDNGTGQMIGDHRFLRLAGPAPQQPLNPEPPAQPGGLGGGLGTGGQPLAQGQQPQAPQLPLQGDQPFQVASNGPTPFPAQPSPAPGVPAAQGAPPAAVSPAAGGIVSPEEVALAKRLLSDPRTFDQGQALALELQKRQAAGPKYDVQVVNGIAYRIDPRTGEAVQVQTPGSQEHVKSAQELGIPAPPGTMFNVDPNGKATSLYQPPQGYQAGAGGQMSPVAGGPADPHAPTNRLEGLKSLRGEVAPVLALATSLRRNYSAVQTGYQQQNGSGDIAMVNGLQKLIDEGVVREGDVTLQLKAQGIKGGIAGALAYINSSGKFSPEIRKGILDTADSLYNNINSTYKDRVMGYRSIADHAYGDGAFGDVVPPDTVKALGWDGSSAPASPKAEERAPGGFTQAQSRKSQELMKVQGASQAKPGDMRNPHVPTTQAQYNALPVGSWFIDDDGSLVKKGAR